MKASWQYYRAMADRRQAERIKQEVLRAQAMKNAREAQGMSRQALAEAIGASACLVQRMEAGLTVPDDRTWLAIVRVLQIQEWSRGSSEKRERERWVPKKVERKEKR